MNRKISNGLILIILILFVFSAVKAGFLDDLQDAASEAAADAVIDKTEDTVTKSIDKGADKVEEGVSKDKKAVAIEQPSSVMVETSDGQPLRLDSIALGLLITEDSFFDPSTEAGSRKVARVKNELLQLIDAGLLGSDLLAELRYSPVILGKLVVKLTDESTAVVSGRQASLDRSARLVQTGLQSLDAILSTLDVQTLSLNFGNLRIQYSALKNPLLVMRQVEADSNVVSAFPDAVTGDGSSLIRRSMSQDVVYQVSNRWGDCPAGCINQKNDYFVVSSDRSGDKLVYEAVRLVRSEDM